MSINQVCISGNLTRDPELRRTQSGMAIMSFGVAVNDRRKNSQTGQWEDYPNFIDCTVFGSYAEHLEHNLFKGNKVAISGKLRWSQWEKDGQKRSKVEVVADAVEYMTQRPQQAQQGYQQPQQAPQPYQQQMPVVNTASYAYDDDIPF